MEQAIVDLIFVDLLEVMPMVLTALVMLDMRGERPGRKGEEVSMRAENEAAVTWVKRWRGVVRNKKE